MSNVKLSDSKDQFKSDIMLKVQHKTNEKRWKIQPKSLNDQVMWQEDAPNKGCFKLKFWVTVRDMKQQLLDDYSIDGELCRYYYRFIMNILDGSNIL